MRSDLETAAAPGWPALVGFCVALQLRTPAVLAMETTEGGGRKSVTLTPSIFWARVAAAERAGVWVELWDHIVEMSQGKRKSHEVYRHFVPFANILSACTRCPEVFGQPADQTVKVPSRVPEGGVQMSLAVSQDSS